MNRYPRLLFVVLSLSIAVLPPVPMASIAAPDEAKAEASAAVDLSANLAIDPRSGELVLTRADLPALEAGPTLAFVRTWRSQAPVRGALGPGWTHTWEERLQILAGEAGPAKSGGTIVWWTSEGEPIALEKVGEGVWESAVGEPLLLQERGGVRALSDRNGLVRNFDKDSGRLVSIEQASGRRVDLEYREGLLVLVTDDAGRSLELEYERGRLLNVRGPLGWWVRVSLGDNGQVAEIKSPAGRDVYEYNASGYLTAIKPGAKRGASFRYDPAGRVLAVEGPCVQGRDYDYGLDDEGARTTELRVAGLGTAFYRFQPDGRQFVTDPMGRTVEIEKDERGLTRQVRVPGSGVFKFDYDARRNLVSLTNPMGNKVVLTYDAANRPLSLTDARGKIHRFEYDGRGNLAKVLRPDGLATSMSWDESGRVSRIDDPTGGAWRYRWDDFGHLAAVIDPTGSEFLYRHDALGRLMEARTPAGGLLRYEYDAAGRLTAIGEGERRVRFEYDEDGLLTAMVSQAGERTEIQRGPRGRIESVRNGLGQTATMSWDGVGKLLAATDATGRAWRYEYDLLGRVTGVMDPAGKQAAYAYNPLGLVSKLSERDGTETAYTYDEIGRLTGMRLPDGEELAIAYDAAGNPVRMTDSDTELVFEYDELGRPTVLRDLKLDVEVRREYDPAGRLTAIVTPWGTIGYDYDAAGRVVAVKPPVGEAITIEHNKDGFPVAYHYPNGQVTRQKRDAGGRVVAVSTGAQNGEPKLVETVSYDLRGFPSESEINGERRVYRYDAAGRLAGDGRGIEFRRDAAGRPVAEIAGKTETALEYDKAGRIARRADVKYEHDARGRMSARVSGDGADSFVWDGADRLRQAKLADGTEVGYRYDPMGRKEARSVNEKEVRYLNLGADRLAALDEQGDALALYVNAPGIDRPLAVMDSRQDIAYLHADANGNVVAVTDHEGKVRQRFEYDPFGRPLADAPSGELMPFGYRGRPWDPAVRWWDMRARFLDPQLGAFTSEDPLGLAASGSMYAYAANNPLVLHDPSGAIPVPLITGAIGAVVGAATYAIPRLWDSAQGKQTDWNWVDFGARTAGGFVIGAGGPLLAGILGAPAALAAGSYLTAGAGFFGAHAAAQVAGMLTEDVIRAVAGSGWKHGLADYVVQGIIGGATGVLLGRVAPLGEVRSTGVRIFGKEMGKRGMPGVARFFDPALKQGMANLSNLVAWTAIGEVGREIVIGGANAIFGLGHKTHGGSGNAGAASLGKDLGARIQALDISVNGAKGAVDMDTAYEEMARTAVEFNDQVIARRVQLIDAERALRARLADPALSDKDKAAIQQQLDGIQAERDDLNQFAFDLLKKAQDAATRAEQTGEVGGPSKASIPTTVPR